MVFWINVIVDLALSVSTEIAIHSRATRVILKGIVHVDIFYSLVHQW